MIFYAENKFMLCYLLIDQTVCKVQFVPKNFNIPDTRLLLVTVMLRVPVPPNIDDALSSSDVIVREGSNVSLTCHATGSPAPSIKWKRDDGSKINMNKSLIGEIHIL